MRDSYTFLCIFFSALGNFIYALLCQGNVDTSESVHLSNKKQTGSTWFQQILSSEYLNSSYLHILNWGP